jgi:high affinity Mn2+ porin
MNNKRLLIVSTITLHFAIVSTYATGETPAPVENAIEESSVLYGQVTNLSQKHSPFKSPYNGINSLDAHGRTEETTDITLYAGIRLWPSAQLWLNPEIDQGFGG